MSEPYYIDRERIKLFRANWDFLTAREQTLVNEADKFVPREIDYTGLLSRGQAGFTTDEERNAFIQFSGNLWNLDPNQPAENISYFAFGERLQPQAAVDRLLPIIERRAALGQEPVDTLKDMGEAEMKARAGVEDEDTPEQVQEKLNALRKELGDQSPAAALHALETQMTPAEEAIAWRVLTSGRKEYLSEWLEDRYGGGMPAEAALAHKRIAQWVGMADPRIDLNIPWVPDNLNNAVAIYAQLKDIYQTAQDVAVREISPETERRIASHIQSVYGALDIFDEETGEVRPTGKARELIRQTAIDRLTEDYIAQATNVSGLAQTIGAEPVSESQMRARATQEVNAFLADPTETRQRMEVERQRIADRDISRALNYKLEETGDFFHDNMPKAAAVLTDFAAMALFSAPTWGIGGGTYMAYRYIPRMELELVEAGAPPQLAREIANISAIPYVGLDFIGLRAAKPMGKAIIGTKVGEAAAKAAGGMAVKPLKYINEAFFEKMSVSWGTVMSKTSVQLAKRFGWRNVEEIGQELGQNWIEAATKHFAYEYADAEGLPPDEVWQEFHDQVLPTISTMALVPVPAAGVDVFAAGVAAADLISEGISPVAPKLEPGDAERISEMEAAIQKAHPVQVMERIIPEDVLWLYEGAKTEEAKAEILKVNGFDADADTFAAFEDAVSDRKVLRREIDRRIGIAKDKMATERSQRANTNLPRQEQARAMDKFSLVHRMLEAAGLTDPTLAPLMFDTVEELEASPDLSQESKDKFDAVLESGVQVKAFFDEASGRPVVVGELLTTEVQALEKMSHEILHGIVDEIGQQDPARRQAITGFVGAVMGLTNLESALPAFYKQRFATLAATDPIAYNAKLGEEYLARLAEKIVDRETLTVQERTHWERLRNWARDHLNITTNEEYIDRTLTDLVRSLMRDALDPELNALRAADRRQRIRNDIENPQPLKLANGRYELRGHEIVKRQQASTTRKAKWDVFDRDGNLIGTRNSMKKAAREVVPAPDIRQIAPDAIFSVADPVESDAFKTWFKDSKVVGADGKPLVVYHGTNRDFTVFEKSTNAHTQLLGFDTFFFTDDPDLAGAYAQAADRQEVGGAQNIMPVYLSMQNPLRIDADGGTWIEAMQEIDSEVLPWRTETERDFYQLRDELIEKYDATDDPAVPVEDRARFEQLHADFEQMLLAGGYWDLPIQGTSVYDGAIITDVWDRPAQEHDETETFNPYTDVYVVFQPEQIKSAAGNIGTFDPTNPDITFSISDISDEFDGLRVGTAWRGEKKTTSRDNNVDISKVLPKELAKQMGKMTHLLQSNKATPRDPDLEIPEWLLGADSPEAQAEVFIDHFVKNLLALHDKFPEDLRAFATQWYDSARMLADDIAAQTGLAPEQAAGILAVLSPQKDWFMNVRMGQNFADIFANDMDVKIDATDYAVEIENEVNRAGKPSRPARRKLLSKIDGRSIREMWEAGDEDLATWGIRIISQRKHGMGYDVLNPDGTVIGPAKKPLVIIENLQWQTALYLKKAMRIALDPSTITDQLGGGHKVRSFYNNIIAPNSPVGDVTIDTHAVAAAWLVPMSSKSYQVGLNFGDAGVAGGSMKGTYWLFQEAYRRAAEARGIQPRQMQSITWEAIKQLFPAADRADKSVAARVVDLWSKNGEAARDEILKDGISRPSWATERGRAGGTERVDSGTGTPSGQEADAQRGDSTGVRRGPVEADGRPSDGISLSVDDQQQDPAREMIVATVWRNLRRENQVTMAEAARYAKKHYPSLSADEVKEVLYAARRITNLVEGRKEELAGDSREAMRVVRSLEISDHYTQEIIKLQEDAYVKGVYDDFVAETRRQQKEAEINARGGLTAAELDDAGLGLTPLLNRLEAEEKLREPIEREAGERAEPGDEVTPSHMQQLAKEDSLATNQYLDKLKRELRGGRDIELKPTEVLKERQPPKPADPEAQPAGADDAVADAGQQQEQAPLPAPKLSAAEQAEVFLHDYRQTLKTALGIAVNQLTYGKTRASLTQWVNNLDDRKTIAGLDRAAQNILKAAYQRRIRDKQNELLAKVNSVIKRRARSEKAIKREDKRSIPAMTNRFLNFAKAALTHDLEHHEGRLDELVRAVKVRGEGENADVTPTKGDLESEILELHAQQLFGALKYRPVADAAQALDYLENELEENIKKHKEKVEARRLLNQANQVTLKTAMEDLGADRDPNTWLEKVTRGAFNSLSAALPLGYRLQMLVAGLPADHEAVKLVKKYIRQFNIADQKQRLAMAEGQQELTKAIESFYRTIDGTPANAQEVYRELVKPRTELGKFSKRNHPLSRAQVLQLIATAEQTSIQKNDDVERLRGMLPEMKKALPATDLLLLDWLRGYYTRTRPALEEVVRETTGLPIAVPDALYMPIRPDMIGGVPISISAPMLIPKSLTHRVQHNRPVDEKADVLHMFFQRLQSNEQFKAYAKLHLDMRGTFAEAGVQEGIRNMYGEEFLNQLMKHMMDVWTGKPPVSHKSREANLITSYFAYSRLSFSPRVFMKQVTSVPAFGYFLPLSDIAMYTAQAPLFFAGKLAGKLGDDVQTAMIEIFQSPQAQERMRFGNSQILNDILHTQGAPAFFRMLKKGMLTTTFGDIIPTLIVGQGFYRAYVDNILKTSAGPSKAQVEAAKAEALEALWQMVELSQQSGAVMNRSEWQRRGDALGRIIGQFTTSPQQFLAREFFMANNFAAKLREHGFLETATEDVKDFLRDVTPGFTPNAPDANLFKTIVINHLLLPLGYNGASMLADLALGEGLDEEDLVVMMLAIAFGPLSGWFLLGGIALALGEEMVRLGLRSAFPEWGISPWDHSDSIIPAGGIIGDAKAFGQAIWGIADWLLLDNGPDLLLDAADNLLRGMAAPYREVRTAVKNYGED